MSIDWINLPVIKDNIFNTHHKNLGATGKLYNSPKVFENRLAKMFSTNRKKVIVKSIKPTVGTTLSVLGKKYNHKSTDNLLLNMIPPCRVTSLKKYMQEHTSASSIADVRLALVKHNSLVKEINITQVHTTTKSLEPLIGA